MKKSHISKILILSLATLAPLVGCGENVSSTEEIIVKGIDIKKINSAVVGDEINLDEYVTVDGNTTDYAVNIQTPDLVSCEGHVLTILGEGNVNIEITAGTESGFIKFNAISKTLNQFKNFSEKVGKNFFKGDIAVANNGSMSFTGKGGFYTEKYNISYSQDKNEKDVYDGFIITNDGEIYSATMDNVSGKNFTVLPGKLSPMYYEASKFDVPYEDLKTETSGKSTYLVGDSSAADAYCSGLGYLTMSRFTSMYYGVSGHGELEIQMIDLTNDTQVYTGALVCLYAVTDEPLTVQGKTYQAGTIVGSDYGLYLADEMFYTLEVAENYIEQNKKPTPLDTTKMYDALQKVATAKNYTVSFDAYWADSNDAKISTAPDLSAYWFSDAFVETSFVQYVTENEVYSKLTKAQNSADDGLFDHYYKDGESFKHQTNKDGKTVTEDVTTGATGVWDEAFTNATLVTSLINDTTARSGLNAVSTKSNGNLFEYKLSGASTGSDFLADILGLNVFYDLKGFYSQKPFVAPYTDCSVFEGLLMTMNVQNDVDNNIIFDITFNWSANEIYHLKTTISNVGSTEIPA